MNPGIVLLLAILASGLVTAHRKIEARWISHIFNGEDGAQK